MPGENEKKGKGVPLESRSVLPLGVKDSAQGEPARKAIGKEYLARRREAGPVSRGGRTRKKKGFIMKVGDLTNN